MRSRFPSLIIAFAGIVLVPAANVVRAQAPVIAHWRFESAPGFSADSSPSGFNLSTAGTAPAAQNLPQTGPGSAFPRALAGNGAVNDRAASFSGAGHLSRADHPSFTPAELTVEGFLHQTTRSDVSTFLASHWQFSGGSQRSWNLAIAGTVPPSGLLPGELFFTLSSNGVEVVVVGSGLVLGVARDYYVAGAFSSGAARFYVRDLALQEGLFVSTRSHSVASLHNSTAALLIGAYNSGERRFIGLIDEVRLTSGVLMPGQLLLEDTPTTPPPLLISGTEFFGTATVAFADPGVGVEIRYTLDGSAPSETSVLYEGPFPLTASATVKARAFSPGLAPSPVRSYPISVRPFTYLGQVRPRHSREIASSTWSVGCETLDRDFAIYANYRHLLGPLGVKSARIQAGWAKTERIPGIYDWAWLDEVVFDMVNQGVRPWMNVSYGNPAYPNGGGSGLGAPVPSSSEAKAAWNAWLGAMVSRYKGTIDEWEIWNEPVGHVSVDDYVDLYIRSAEIIRGLQPEARLIALALAGIDLTYTGQFLEALRSAGKLHLVDEIAYHAYVLNPEGHYGAVQGLRNLIASTPGAGHILVRQGENGAPSQQGGFGALNSHPWTEATQAKWNLRRMLGDLGRDIATNVFTLMELYYPTGLNSKGLIRANPDKTVGYLKPAYFAVRNVTALFDGRISRIAPLTATHNGGPSLNVFGYQRTDINRPIVTLWTGGAVPTNTDTYASIDITVPLANFSEPVWVDVRLGAVRSLPHDAWTSNGVTTTFQGIPVPDSPILLADRAAVFSPYDEWATLQFTPEDAVDLDVSGYDADPNLDGISNLLAFATARSAYGSTAAPAVSTRDVGGRLALSFVQLHPAPVQYVVEASSNLEAWIVLARCSPGGAWETDHGAAIQLGAPGGTPVARSVEVIDGVLLESQPSRFLRLKIIP